MKFNTMALRPQSSEKLFLISYDLHRKRTAFKPFIIFDIADDTRDQLLTAMNTDTSAFRDFQLCSSVDRYCTKVPEELAASFSVAEM